MKVLNRLLIKICKCAFVLFVSMGYAFDSKDLQNRQQSIKQDTNNAFFSPKTGAAVVEELPNPFAFRKDGAYYLAKNAQILQSFLNQVHKQTLEGNFPFYDRRILVEHSAYRTLNQSQKQHLKGAIVLISGFISSFIKYSHLGGVGVSMTFAKQDEEMFYASFDGRYLTDLDALKQKATKIYAYCVLPRFDKCIMLGIGEEW